MNNVEPLGPSRGRFAQWSGRAVMRLLGWKAVGEAPRLSKAVFVASPHTSNWDGIIMVTVSFAMGVRLKWMVKDSVYRFPFRWLLRSVGAIPVNRNQSANRVEGAAQAFRECEGMYLAIAPAGTRSRRDYWKSGFYHIALAADVPLLCGVVDWRRREAGIIGMVEPTGDVHRDMAAVRELYEGRMGKHPHRMTEMRLRLEDSRQEREAA